MKEAKPAAPVVAADPANASVSVTPTGEVDKVKVTFTPTDGTTEKTIEIAKEDGVWKDKSNTPGVTVNPTTGLVTLDHTVAKDGTAVKAVATKGNSDVSNEGTANDPVKVYILKGEPAREFEVEIPLPIVVPDPEHLTSEVKTELEKKVKKSNPNMDVKVDDKGNVTITDPKTGQSKVIPVKDLTVKDFEPVKPTDKVPAKDKAHLTQEEKKQVADKVKAKNPGKEVTVEDDGTATVTDPTTGISHTIPGTDLVIEFAKGDSKKLEVPELIITKWTDEQDNILKPAVLGEANEAYEHGEIEGYVFVRTETKGDVVTHIFRKVTPTKPEGNGEQQGGDNKPESTPEAPAETENTTTKSKASQNILPNTGTAKGVGIFSAAAASILAGLGLIIPVKKEDEEEEETQNN